MIIQCPKCCIRYNDLTVSECPICLTNKNNRDYDMSFEEIGNILGVTKQRAFALYNKAIAKLSAPQVSKEFKEGYDYD